MTDTHQQLRTLVSLHGAAFHNYICALKSNSMMFEWRQYYREDLDKSMETILQYVHERYQRKVNTNDH